MEKTAVREAAGNGGMPKMVMAAPDGATAEVYLYGGQVTSWKTARGEEQLFLSQQAEFLPGTAIRGGVPVIFPQFSDLGPLPKHGFARDIFWEPDGWEIEADGKLTFHLFLTDSPETRQIWPQAFRVDLSVTIGGQRLDLRLAVKNTGSQPWAFMAALHTYFQIDQVSDASIEGLRETAYWDQARGRVREIDEENLLRFQGEIDRAYLDAPARLILHDDDRVRIIEQAGFTDTVVWNPGEEKAAALTDLEPGGWQHYLCIEPALIGTPITLQPGAVWHGAQSIIA